MEKQAQETSMFKKKMDAATNTVEIVQVFTLTQTKFRTIHDTNLVINLIIGIVE
jgi:hypothetical protein